MTGVECPIVVSGGAIGEDATATTFNRDESRGATSVLGTEGDKFNSYISDHMQQ